MKSLTQKEVVSVIRMAETVRNQAMIAIAYRHSSVFELNLKKLQKKAKD
jgi:hypothetical protein